MEFRFKFQNDCSEPADRCIRCGHFTQERSLLRCSGVRLTVYACRTCLAEIAFFLWFFHEFPLRAAILSKEKSEAGEPEYCYEKSFSWLAGNGFPLPAAKKNSTRKGV